MRVGDLVSHHPFWEGPKDPYFNSGVIVKLYSKSIHGMIGFGVAVLESGGIIRTYLSDELRVIYDKDKDDKQ